MEAIGRGVWLGFGDVGEVSVNKHVSSSSSFGFFLSFGSLSINKAERTSRCKGKKINHLSHHLTLLSLQMREKKSIQ